MTTNPLGAEHEDPGTTSATYRLRKITGADILAVIGTIAALFTTFVIVEPWILVFPPWVKPLLATLLVVSCITLTRAPYEPLERYFDIMPLIRHLLVTAGVILFILLLTWTPPTSQLMAQQVLAKQGMFLRRLYYKTALEIGNVTGVGLFHQAGFKKSLAFELLGERAETVRDRRSVDVFLNNDPAVFNSLLLLFASESDSTETGLPPQSDLGLDTPIRYRDSDAGADTAPRLVSDISVSASTSETVNQLLNSEGVPLLGHAVLGRAATAVEALLRSGADPTLGSLPLLAAGHSFDEGFELLAVDPFLYVETEMHGQPEALSQVQEAMENREIRPSVFAEYSTEIPACESQLASFRRDDRFLGYRQAPSGTDVAHELVEFLVRNVLRCQEEARDPHEAEGALRFAGDSEVRNAILRVVSHGVVENERASSRLASLTTRASDNSVYEHYIGTYSNVATGGSGSSRRLLSGESVAGSQNEWSIALISTEVDIDGVEARVRDVRNLTVRAAPIDCEGEDLDLSVPGTKLSCQSTARISWEGSPQDHLIVIESEDSQLRRYVVSADEDAVDLPEGRYLLVPIPLSTTARSDDERSFKFAYQRTVPIVTEPGDDTSALWPSDEIGITGELGAEEERFVNLNLEEWADIVVRLENLNSDVDIELAGRDNEAFQFASLNAAANSERIAERLAPGRYQITLSSFGEASSYRLTVSSAAVDVTPLTDSGNGYLQSDFDGRQEENWLSFATDGPGRVRVCLQPRENDLDLQIFDLGGSILGSSTEAGTLPDVVDLEVDSGTYYARVFRYGEDRGGVGRHRVTVSNDSVELVACQDDLGE